MTVSLGNGRTLKFKEWESGLYFYDTEKNENNVEEINDINENKLNWLFLFANRLKKLKLNDRRKNIQSIQGKELPIDIVLAINNEQHKNGKKQHDN